MTRARLAGAALWLAAWAGSAAALEHVWNTATDFSAGSFYAVTAYNQGATSRVGLTLAQQSMYTADPSETTGLTFWSRNIANLRILPYAVYGHAVVVVGDWVYAMGGCQKDTGGCGSAGVSRTVASVWFHQIDAAGNILGPWTLADYELGAQNAGAGLGVPMRNHRAVAVGNRIYVVGGATSNCGAAPYPGTQPATVSVYSALVDPATGQTGPWRVELPLSTNSEAHGLVYAGGALFALGGFDGTNPDQIAEKAEINPANGALYGSGGLHWDPALPVPPGNPPASCSLCSLCSCGTCAPCTEGCCRALDVCLGWMWISPFAVMRTIGFVGGAYVPSVSESACRQFHGTYHGYLDDCNNIQDWTVRDANLGLFGAGAIVYNGSLVQVGGGDGSALTQQALFNPIDPASGTGKQGIVRDFATGDGSELYPGDPDGTGLVAPAAPFQFAVPASFLTGVMHHEWAYVVGGAMTNSSEPCNYVYRALMKSSTWWVDAGSFVSAPYDLGGTFQLTRVAWSYTKTGGKNLDGNPNDWAIVRYRTASPAGIWTCWSPRIPEESSMPVTPGYYVYASDAASVLYREPLITELCRYVQFEVSLYNDPRDDGASVAALGTPTLPQFDEFRISYQPATAPKPVTCPLEVYPNPARDTVTIRYQVDPAGGEVTARIFNAAAHLADQESYTYLSGGIKEETIKVTAFAQGAYVIIVDALGHGGGPGLVCASTGELLKTAKSKFVVRH